LTWAAGELEEVLAVVPDWLAGLDLLARIRAQQGRLSDAVNLWTTAAALAPEDLRIADSLAYARTATRARSQLYRVGRLSIVALLLIGVVAAGSYLLRQGDRSQSTARRTSESPATSGLVAANDSVSKRTAPHGVEPPGFTGISGVKVDTAGAVLLLTPDEGVFSDGTVLTTAGVATLGRLGAALVAAPEPLDVIVIGHTDSVPFRAGSVMDNEWLGLQRAVTVMRHLHRSVGVPTEVMTAKTAGSTQPPFATGTHLEQMKNRTVTFLVTGSGDSH
jgi:type VI secretion system protein ImpK